VFWGIRYSWIFLISQNAKCSNTFLNTFEYFGILWNTLRYFFGILFWNTLRNTYEKNGTPQGIYLGLTLNTFRIPLCLCPLPLKTMEYPWNTIEYPGFRGIPRIYLAEIVEYY